MGKGGIYLALRCSNRLFTRVNQGFMLNVTGTRKHIFVMGVKKKKKKKKLAVFRGSLIFPYLYQSLRNFHNDISV